MLRVCCDFNSRTPEGDFFTLCCDGIPLEGQIAKFGLATGSRVILYPEEEDFEVVASLSHEHLDFLGGEVWLARADWDTIRRHS